MLKTVNSAELEKILRSRADNIRPEIIATVTDVINEIKLRGDEALIEYTKRFDGVELDGLFMTDEEFEAGAAKTPEKLKEVMKRAAENIRAFHEKQKQQSWVYFGEGMYMGQRVLPLRRVGVYVPGGTAAYPSSVLMNIIPAKVAGVEEIIMATPPKNEGINPAVLYAAKLAGATKILKAGGAQAIAALAYGTQSIERVDKITGPGNIFVATAKRLVYGAVDIDMIAGPSEVLVIADENSNPAYIAADLMAQAEHDPMAAAVLISTSDSTIEKVNRELERQIKTLSRADIIKNSLAEYGLAVKVESFEEAAKLSDLVAPEHLELALSEPAPLLGLIHNAGSVFLGQSSPEPLGDYYAGPNHVLPTGGTARFSSALSVDSFVKKSSYMSYTPERLKESADDVMAFAEAEGLTAHANSIKVRVEQ